MSGLELILAAALTLANRHITSVTVLALAGSLGPTVIAASAASTVIASLAATRLGHPLAQGAPNTDTLRLEALGAHILLHGVGILLQQTAALTVLERSVHGFVGARQ